MTEPHAILVALRRTPDNPAAWQAYAEWHADNGRDDEAAAVRGYSSAPSLVRTFNEKKTAGGSNRYSVR